MDFSSDFADKLLMALCEDLPQTVCCAEIGQLTPAQIKQDFADLAAAERELIEKAVDGRKGEFSAARRLARQALAQIGYQHFPLLKDNNGAPRWPADVVGSITHCAGFRAALVSKDLRAVGIDAEPARPLPAGVLDSIAGEEEKRQIRKCGLGIPLDTVLFSVKETIYKSWYPLTGMWLGFEDAQVNLMVQELVSQGSGCHARGTFSARVTSKKLSEALSTGAVVAQFEHLKGQWFISSDLIVAICLVPSQCDTQTPG